MARRKNKDVEYDYPRDNDVIVFVWGSDLPFEWGFHKGEMMMWRQLRKAGATEYLQNHIDETKKECRESRKGRAHLQGCEFWVMLKAVRQGGTWWCDFTDILDIEGVSLEAWKEATADSGFMYDDGEFRIRHRKSADIIQFKKD